MRANPSFVASIVASLAVVDEGRVPALIQWTDEPGAAAAVQGLVAMFLPPAVLGVAKRRHRQTATRVLHPPAEHFFPAEHPWFKSSKTNKTAEKRDWYIWADSPNGTAPGTVPPNNWLSFFGGPAWTFEPTTQQWCARVVAPGAPGGDPTCLLMPPASLLLYFHPFHPSNPLPIPRYLHQYLAEMPDLNWRNPAVLQEFKAIIRFWIAQCVTSNSRRRHQGSSNPSRYDEDKKAFLATLRLFALLLWSC